MGGFSMEKSTAGKGTKAGLSAAFKAKLEGMSNKDLEAERQRQHDLVFGQNSPLNPEQKEHAREVFGTIMQLQQMRTLKGQHLAP